MVECGERVCHGQIPGLRFAQQRGPHASLDGVGCPGSHCLLRDDSQFSRFHPFWLLVGKEGSEHFGLRFGPPGMASW